ncbi:hypothetical protein QQG55_54710 [Brugia pahangi]
MLLGLMKQKKTCSYLIEMSSKSSETGSMLSSYLLCKEMEKRFNELRKYVWRRIDPARRLGVLRGRARGFRRRTGYAVMVTMHQVLVSHRQFVINPAV